MRKLIVVALLGLLGAGPADVQTESAQQRAGRLQMQVEALRKTNMQLQQRLADLEAERAALAAQLRLAQGRAQVVPAPALPSVPQGNAPWFYQPGPALPQDALPRGEGNVRHYVIPAGSVTTGSLVNGR